MEQLGARIQRLEKIPEEARSEIHDFDKILQELYKKKEILGKERKARKPWKWRLADAEKLVLKAEKKKAALESDIRSIRHQQAELAERLEAQQNALEDNIRMLDEANAAAAAVREELAQQTIAGEVMSPQSQTHTAMQGLLTQIRCLSMAVESGNLEAAVGALQSQAAAINFPAEATMGTQFDDSRSDISGMGSSGSGGYGHCIAPGVV